jgi:hypothetical protein
MHGRQEYAIIVTDEDGNNRAFENSQEVYS